MEMPCLFGVQCTYAYSDLVIIKSLGQPSDDTECVFETLNKSALHLAVFMASYKRPVKVAPFGLDGASADDRHLALRAQRIQCKTRAHVPGVEDEPPVARDREGSWHAPTADANEASTSHLHLNWKKEVPMTRIRPPC